MVKGCRIDFRYPFSLKLVPRDRIFIAFGDFNRLGRSNAPTAHKLPTRGFSVNYPELPNLLK